MKNHWLKTDVLEDLDMGDLVIKDSGSLGLDVYHKDGKKICFFNSIGCETLRKWLEKKNKKEEEYVNNQTDGESSTGS